MKITTKEVRDVTRVIDSIIKEYKSDSRKEKRDWRTYEQRLTLRMKKAIQELTPLIEEAIETLNMKKDENRGRKPKLSLKQKVMLILLKQLFEKSNREMSVMLTLFSLLTEVDVGYKTVERLYSDDEVVLVLHNLHNLLLARRDIKKVDASGDGSGYSLTIKKHYASEAQKLKKKLKTAKGKSKRKIFFYNFILMDLNTRMYIAYGTSFKSEKEAYASAMAMAEEKGIEIERIRLDKYYSAQKYIRELVERFKNIEPFMIPKTNATIKGPLAWKHMLYHFVTDPVGFLEIYFARNQSESGFSEDKRRTGWKLSQKREDRLDTAVFCKLTWHNLFWLG